MWGESTGDRWIPSQRTDNADFNFLCMHKQAFEQTVELPLILDATALMWRHCNASIYQVTKVEHVNSDVVTRL